LGEKPDKCTAYKTTKHCVGCGKIKTQSRQIRKERKERNHHGEEGFWKLMDGTRGRGSSDVSRLEGGERWWGCIGPESSQGKRLGLILGEK